MRYLVEMGADRGRIVRMTGGINAWKKASLGAAMDLIFGICKLAELR